MTKEYTLYIAESNVESDGNNVYLSFITDAQRFIINYAVSDIRNGNFPHVGITAREGLAVLYKNYDECIGNVSQGEWMPVDLLARDYKSLINMSHMIKRGQKYKIIIYGPILAHLERLSVEIDESDYYCSKSMRSNLKKILFLGGAKTFGIGVTSTAMMFSNIIRRNNEIEVDRISYNQRNFLKNISDFLDDTIETINYDMIILESDGIGQDKKMIECYLDKILSQLSKDCVILIWHSLPKTDLEKKKLLSGIVKNRVLYSTNCIYLNLDFIFSEEYIDLCTYSVNFVNDAGNILIYESLNQEIKRCLWNI
ncbi:MAG: hypothetical protein K2O65_05755 [Lachnospiraceae bacterium]|nr:hypothetical protein [Lachnospiraceae bacterium]